MIGPHEGKELELMLAGKKSLAVFHDDVPEGQEIPEEIIPERAFAPYVSKGVFKRFSEDMRSSKDGTVIRFVCFTSPGEEWRAAFFLWLKREFYEGRLPYNPAQEYIIGRLLGYESSDIDDFVNRKMKAA